MTDNLIPDRIICVIPFAERVVASERHDCLGHYEATVTL